MHHRSGSWIKGHYRNGTCSFVKGRCANNMLATGYYQNDTRIRKIKKEKVYK